MNHELHSRRVVTAHYFQVQNIKGEEQATFAGPVDDTV